MFKDQKNIYLKLSSLGHAHNDAYHFIIPLLLPFFRQEFLFSYFQSGLILTIHVALRSIFSLAFGSLSDRYGHKHIFIAIGFLLSSVLLGSIVWITDPSFMIIVLLLMAIGVSTFHPLATTMVGERAKPNKRGRELSMFSAAGTLGVITISLLFGWLVQVWGWKITCFFVSLPGFFLAWGYAQLKKEVRNESIEKGKLAYRNLFIVYFIGHGLFSLGTWAILSFFPIYATDYVGLKPDISAWIVSIFFAGVLVGNLLLSQILDQIKPLKIINLATMYTALILFALTYSNIPTLIYFLVACIGLSQGFYFPVQNTWLIKVSSNRAHGMLFGFVFFIEGFSATVAPSIYGWLADRHGLLYAYRMASIPIFISFLLYLILYQMAKTHQNKDFNSVKLKKMDYFKEAS